MDNNDQIEAAINPQHYKDHPSGVESIEVIETMPFLLGSACKYLFRLGKKDLPLQELKKAEWYLKKWLDLPVKQRPPLVDRLSSGQRRFMEWSRGVYALSDVDCSIRRIVWASCNSYSNNVNVNDYEVRDVIRVLMGTIADLERKEGTENEV